MRPHLNGLPVLMGHQVNGRVYEFPHACPGPDCAVARYLVARSYRVAYETLKPQGECPACGWTGPVGMRCEDCGCDDYAPLLRSHDGEVK